MNAAALPPLGGFLKTQPACVVPVVRLCLALGIAFVSPPCRFAASLGLSGFRLAAGKERTIKTAIGGLPGVCRVAWLAWQQGFAARRGFPCLPGWSACYFSNSIVPRLCPAVKSFCAIGAKFSAIAASVFRRFFFQPQKTALFWQSKRRFWYLGEFSREMRGLYGFYSSCCKASSRSAASAQRSVASFASRSRSSSARVNSSKRA